MGKMHTTSRTGERLLMQSIGSRSGGLREVRQRPGSALPFDDSTRSASAHCDTVSGLRGAIARATACAMRGAAGGSVKLAVPSGMDHRERVMLDAIEQM